MVTKELTEEEWELVEAVRNLKNSTHNPSAQLEYYVRKLFDNLLNKD
ncbi:hypothetical protein AGMMS4956_18860 [Bacteroidia bacterium]|nr:hypothetical protein AGMMS4956_18860 [Bacteroidia bacterium]